MKASEIRKKLKDCGIDNFNREAEILIEELCGSFSEEEDYSSEALANAVEKRCSRYPL